ncbi:hypothetical protein [Gynuella sunshinyii]|uniref:Transposase n=1 Tax=Gynuella sunshinyii YC6258 TaxID=1445510 RepID=A0A0C5VT32_9GAMM|nr:hypothetical protein [Gynuella sunshinyii]AJQ97346.1 transposase [Gynuella sunshinyii YC6258]
MNKKELEALEHEAAKSIKTEADLDDFQKMPTKVTLETTFNAEMDDHLGYESTSPMTIPTAVMADPIRP